MKVTEIDYTTKAIRLASEMVNKGLCEFTLNGGVYGTVVNHITFSLHAPRWNNEGDYFQLDLTLTTNSVGANKAVLKRMELILSDGFESDPKYIETKQRQIAEKEALIERLQAQLKKQMAI